MSVLLLIAALIPTAQAETIRVEGENYSNVGGPSQIRVVERSAASGGKVVSYWEEQGVSLEWELDVPEAGAYAVSFRYACRWPDSHRRVEIDGKLSHPACESVRFGTTGDWAKHAVHTLGDEHGVPIVVKLGPGKHRLRLTNVKSRGLAIDVIFVHDPVQRFADVALTEAEMAPLRTLTLAHPATEPTLSEREMRLGNVNARFDSTGLTSVWVAHTLFEVPHAARERPSPEARLDRTANLLMRLQRHQSRWQLYVTDGQAFFAVVASAVARQPRVALWPRAYSKGSRLWESVVWRDDVGAHYPLEASVHDPAIRWQVGQARIWGSTAFTPREHAMQFAEPRRVAAVKVCPVRWQEKGLAVEATPGAVLSSVEDYPGLAAFYGYGRFKVTFGWEGDALGRCEVEDGGSRERVQLWPPAP